MRKLLRKALAPNPSDRFDSMESLRHALASGQRRKARIRNSVLAIGLAATGAAAAMGFAGQSNSESHCEDGAKDFAKHWNAERSASTGRGFAATSKPEAATAWLLASQAIDDYGDDWRASFRSACLATKEKNVQSPLLLDRRMLCLDQRLNSD